MFRSHGDTKQLDPLYVQTLTPLLPHKLAPGVRLTGSEANHTFSHPTTLQSKTKEAV